MAKQIKTTCLKCNTEVTLDMGEASYSEALKLIDKLDKRPMECPGFHVEVGGWKKYWQLKSAVEASYSEDEKSECRNIVRHIIIKLIGVFPSDNKHEFETEKEAFEFVKELVDRGLSDTPTLIVTRYNALKEYIGEYKDSAEKVLIYLGRNHMH